MWSGGDAYGGGSVTESVVCYDALDPQQPLWTTSGIGGIASTPCVANGLVYVGCADGNLYCLSILDGGIEWQAQTLDRNGQPSRILASPVVYGGNVYIGNEASIIYAFAADTDGGAVWQQPIVLDLGATGVPSNKWNMTGVSSPAIATAGGTDYLVFGCDDGYVYWIDLSNPDVPDEDHRVDLGGCVESSVSVWAGDTLFVGASRYDTDKNFFRISWDAEHGRFGNPEGIPLAIHECRATPALRPGTGTAPDLDSAYVGVDTGYTFHRTSVEGRFEELTDHPFTVGEDEYFVGSAAVTSGGLVFVGNDNHRLYVLDALVYEENSSESQWKKMQPPKDLEGVVCSSPALSTNVDGAGQLWLFVTSRKEFTPGEEDYGTLWAFTVHEETE